MFQATSQRDSFQGRYILQHPFTGNLQCSAGRQYKSSLNQRFEKEAQTLARLTNWNIQNIRQKMQLSLPTVSTSWWDKLLAWLGV
jgi:hypothetical protein